MVLVQRILWIKTGDTTEIRKNAGLARVLIRSLFSGIMNFVLTTCSGFLHQGPFAYFDERNDRASLVRCAACYHHDTDVIDSRVIDEGRRVRRRRVCAKCKFRFSTYEEMEVLDLVVVKRDGREEPYSRQKLELGLWKAFEKRPMTTDKMEKLLGVIERDMSMKATVARANGHPARRTITSTIIGEIVIRAIKRMDPVAYLRFASVYKSFDTVQAFQQELRALKQ